MSPGVSPGLAAGLAACTPEHAWELALAELQKEMARATFEKWLAGVRLVGYADGTMTIGLPGDEAREWVASRLTSTLTRSLLGIMNRPVELAFVTITPEAVAAAGPEQDGDPAGEETGGVDLFELQRTSLRESLLQPERIVAVPGYFLRWLPYLGPGKAWLVVALRQAFYFSYGKGVVANAPFEVSGAQAARWSGLARRTIHTYLQDSISDKNDILGWFVEHTGKTSGQANTYRFRLAMPLTPGDVRRLSDWLVEHGAHTDPLAALQLAVSLPPRDLLPYPAPGPELAPGAPNPQTIQQVVLAVCSALPAESAAELARLADQLAGRLMPQQDQIIISHYFLLHWLPLLGPGPAWMITLLRDQCYHDHHTGELRDRIVLNDGYQELARALGLNRAKTIGDWLPPLESMAHQRQPVASSHWQKRQGVREWVGLFLEKTDYTLSVGRSGKAASWQFRMRLDDPPLPEHETALATLAYLSEAARAGDPILDIIRDGTLEEVEAHLDTWILAYRVDPPGGPLLFGARFAHPSDEIEARFAHPSGSIEARFAQVRAELRRDLHTIKLLILKHLNLKLFLTPPPAREDPRAPDPETAKSGGGDISVPTPPPSLPVWNLAYLLETGSVPPEQVSQCLAEVVSFPELAVRMVAWIIYGYTHAGRGKGEIHNPAQLAVKRRETAPPPGCLELARLGAPAILERLQQGAWHGHPQGEILKALAAHGFQQVLLGLAPDSPLPASPPFAPDAPTRTNGHTPGGR